MSSAFVREREGGEAFEDLPDRPVSPHPNFVTREGLARIESELARLQAEVAGLGRDDAADARVARDLRYWTSRLGSAQLVERGISETVRFGSTVTILRADGTRGRFRLVGEDEADPSSGSIAYVAPMARALTGGCIGDLVRVAGQEIEIVALD